MDLNKSECNVNKFYIYLVIFFVGLVANCFFSKITLLDKPLETFAQVAAIIQAIAACGIAVQIWQSRNQIKADHERSRREKSVDVLFQWSNSLEKNGTLARKIVISLDEKQCLALVQGESFSILKSNKDKLEIIFPDEKFDEDGDFIKLEVRHSVGLRYLIINYLNNLEFVLVAWQYSVVDRGIFEHQLKYLFDPSLPIDSSLSNFRKAAGGMNVYPAIEVFAAHMQNKKQEELENKLPVA